MAMLALVTAVTMASAAGDDRSMATPLGAAVPSHAGYTLIWHDEFDVDGPPDPANWVPETGFIRNREWQWYQLRNANCAGGLLVIEAKAERAENPRFDPEAPESDWKRSRKEAPFTSASIKTMGLYRFQFGRFEMRGRIDIRAGMWPAFWSVGSGTPETPARPWPNNGEIDIMEFYDGLLLANGAWGSAKPGAAQWDDVKIPIEEFAKRAGYANAAAWAADFHVWRLDWTAEKMSFFCDDLLLNEVDLERTFNTVPDADGVRGNPFREPHHLILNLAIRGAPTEAIRRSLPAKFEVDWVRVYQAETPVGSMNVTPQTDR